MVRRALRIKFVIWKIIILVIVMVIKTAMLGNAAVYLFGGSGNNETASLGKPVPVTLKSTCTVNFAPGTSGKISLLFLMRNNCNVEIGTGSNGSGQASQKFPPGGASLGFYFTTKVKVTLEVGGAQGGGGGGKGGVTGLTFVFEKEEPMDPYVLYVIGKRGRSGSEKSGGGGGSMIIIGARDVINGISIYPRGTTSPVSKEQVIAVIAGGGMGHPLTYPGCGGRTTGDHGGVALYQGDVGDPWPYKIPRGKGQGGYGGGGDAAVPEAYYGSSVPGGGGGYGGGGWIEGYRLAGAYCSFFGLDSTSSGCYGGDGQNSNADGYGFIKLEPIP